MIIDEIICGSFVRTSNLVPELGLISSTNGSSGGCSKRRSAAARSSPLGLPQVRCRESFWVICSGSPSLKGMKSILLSSVAFGLGTFPCKELRNALDNCSVFEIRFFG